MLVSIRNGCARGARSESGARRAGDAFSGSLLAARRAFERVEEGPQRSAL